MKSPPGLRTALAVATLITSGCAATGGDRIKLLQTFEIPEMISTGHDVGQVVAVQGPGVYGQGHQLTVTETKDHVQDTVLVPTAVDSLVESSSGSFAFGSARVSGELSRTWTLRFTEGLLIRRDLSNEVRKAAMLEARRYIKEQDDGREYYLIQAVLLGDRLSYSRIHEARKSLEGESEYVEVDLVDNFARSERAFSGDLERTFPIALLLVDPLENSRRWAVWSGAQYAGLGESSSGDGLEGGIEVSLRRGIGYDYEAQVVIQTARMSSASSTEPVQEAEFRPVSLLLGEFSRQEGALRFGLLGGGVLASMKPRALPSRRSTELGWAVGAGLRYQFAPRFEAVARFVHFSVGAGSVEDEFQHLDVDDFAATRIHLGIGFRLHSFLMR